MVAGDEDGEKQKGDDGHANEECGPEKTQGERRGNGREWGQLRSEPMPGAVDLGRGHWVSGEDTESLRN